MIINVRNVDDLITVDVSTRQIRYVDDRFVSMKGFIHFYDLSRADADAFEYLFEHDKKLFITSLIETIYDLSGKKLKKKDLKVVTL